MASSTTSTTPTHIAALFARLVASDKRQDDMLKSILALKHQQEADLGYILKHEKLRTADLIALRHRLDENAASVESKLRAVLTAGDAKESAGGGVSPQTEHASNGATADRPNPSSTAQQQDHSPPAGATPSATGTRDSSSLSRCTPPTKVFTPHVHTQVQALRKTDLHAAPRPSKAGASIPRPRRGSGTNYCSPWNFEPAGCEASTCPDGKLHVCFVCHKWNKPSDHRFCGCNYLPWQTPTKVAPTTVLAPNAVAVKGGPGATEDSPKGNDFGAPAHLDSDIAKTTESAPAPVRTTTATDEGAQAKTSTVTDSALRVRFRKVAPLPKMGTDDDPPVYYYCYAWNTIDGTCKAPTCPDGSLHNCYFCHPKNQPSNHTAINCPAMHFKSSDTPKVGTSCCSATADAGKPVVPVFRGTPVLCEAWNSSRSACEGETCARGHLHQCTICFASGRNNCHRSIDHHIYTGTILK
ncbi:uncharacterized protein LOC62_03G004354 [Vanrija pseudolonga]|uniref:Uncharacterized protein n=1 Tax=Vanrija pseudolonga TaxID=143232 RepID=A0AAF0YA35_9TREE|nr:hypothetical protein LOC62_03G004354 [Vanrija pseudolonga]